jgi:hypothetical protein
MILGRDGKRDDGDDEIQTFIFYSNSFPSQFVKKSLNFIWIA